MARGLEIIKSNTSPAFIIKLLKNVPLDMYDLYTGEEEMIGNNKNIYFDDVISYSDFKGIVKDEIDLIILLNIQAYPYNSQKEAIRNYQDFINSKCEMILLINDTQYIEVYSKNQDVINQVLENAQKLNCDSILIKTDDNDGRTRMSVS